MQKITLNRAEIEKLVKFAEQFITYDRIMDGIEGHKYDSEIEPTIQNIKDTLTATETKLYFTASILFNKGLGNQIKETSQFHAKSLQEAQKVAESLANQIVGEEKWKEVKVRPFYEES